jgi:predicted HTH domain antitoxin
MVAKNKAVTIRVPQELLELIELYSKEQHIDVSSAIRQWLYRAAEEYALQLVEAGRISGGRAAEILDTSLFDIYRLAEAQGIRLGADEDQQRRSRDLAARTRLKAKRGDNKPE